MPVYVDDMLMEATVQNGGHQVTGRWSHLMADTDDELHAFAVRLGLRREWAQYPGTVKSHYDVTANVRDHAIRMGAIPINYGQDSWRLMQAKIDGVPFDPPGQQAFF